MGFSLAVRNALLGHYFGKSTLSPPANYYVALAKSDDSEPSGGGYTRVETDSADWDDPAAGVVVNLSTITFPTPTDTWGSITKMKLFDAASGGNELASTNIQARDVTAITPAPESDPGSLRFILTDADA